MRLPRPMRPTARAGESRTITRGRHAAGGGGASAFPVRLPAPAPPSSAASAAPSPVTLARRSRRRLDELRLRAAPPMPLLAGPAGEVTDGSAGFLLKIAMCGNPVASKRRSGQERAGGAAGFAGPGRLPRHPGRGSGERRDY